MRPRTFLHENHFRQLQPLVALQRLVVELSAREIVARTNISRLNNISEMSYNCGEMLGIETGVWGAGATLKSDVVAAEVAAGRQKVKQDEKRSRSMCNVECETWWRGGSVPASGNFRTSKTKLEKYREWSLSCNVQRVQCYIKL